MIQRFEPIEPELTLTGKNQFFAQTIFENLSEHTYALGRLQGSFWDGKGPPQPGPRAATRAARLSALRGFSGDGKSWVNGAICIPIDSGRREQATGLENRPETRWKTLTRFSQNLNSQILSKPPNQSKLRLKT